LLSLLSLSLLLLLMLLCLLLLFFGYVVDVGSVVCSGWLSLWPPDNSRRYQQHLSVA